MIIYTCITNGYDELPDENYNDPDVKYICYTDGTIEHKEPWEFRDIPIQHECPRRLSAYPKINPHKLFPMGSKTVWIDGCYIMTKKFVDESRRILSQSPFTIMRHCERFSYMDEILEGFLASMNTFEDQVFITEFLKEKGFNFFKYSSPVLGAIWRTLSEDMVRLHDLWWEWSLIGPNRDQLSFEGARQYTKTKLDYLEHGWLDPKDGKSAGSVGVVFGSGGKKYRRKRHPQAGHMEQYKERDKMLNAIRKITGMHPKLYATYDHQGFINNNVIDPKWPPS